jgi:para-aminobenzoate synthetase component 1
VIVTTIEHWRDWASSYTMLPYIIKLGLAEDRIQSWEKAWEAASPDSFVLESGKGGRYTFLGLQPLSTIRGYGQEAEITLAAQGQMAPEGQSPQSRKVIS